uniref:Uncharacterized protein n=1 Tax=viral metagenome TaxID=1070528 RepID=A0A6C0KDQ7_9ZZZZ
MRFTAAASTIQRWWRCFFTCPATAERTHPSNASVILHAGRLLRVNTAQLVRYLRSHSMNTGVFNVPLSDRSMRVLLMDFWSKHDGRHSRRLKRKCMSDDIASIHEGVRRRKLQSEDTLENASSSIVHDLLFTIRYVASLLRKLDDDDSVCMSSIIEAEWTGNGTLLFNMRRFRNLCYIYEDGEQNARRVVEKMMYEALVHESEVPSEHVVQLCNAILYTSTVLFESYAVFTDLPANASELIPAAVRCRPVLAKIYAGYAQAGLKPKE